MHWIAFLAACLALVLARLLRAPNRSSLVTGAAGFVLAFLVTTIGVRFIANEAGITRPNDYNAFIVHASNTAETDAEAPIILFLGASFSRNAIDGEALTEDLRQLGYPHRVINLSLEGASLQERDAHLREFLDYSGLVPDVVFIEAAQEFDADPTYVFRVAKFSDRAIGQFAPRAVFWSLKGLSQGQCDGLVNCGKSWGFLAAHAGMNFTNLGLLATGEALSGVEAIPAYDPQDTRRDEFILTADEIAAHLDETVTFEPSSGPSWARLFRTEQRAFLEETGVRRIAYYYPPVLPASDRAYVAGLCAGELADYPCIAPVDPGLLHALKGEFWFDEKHLLTPGADIYRGWLVQQIESWGALK